MALVLGAGRDANRAGLQRQRLEIHPDLTRCLADRAADGTERRGASDHRDAGPALYHFRPKLRMVVRPLCKKLGDPVDLLAANRRAGVHRMVALRRPPDVGDRGIFPDLHPGRPAQPLEGRSGEGTRRRLQARLGQRRDGRHSDPRDPCGANHRRNLVRRATRPRSRWLCGGHHPVLLAVADRRGVGGP